MSCHTQWRTGKGRCPFQSNLDKLSFIKISSSPPTHMYLLSPRGDGSPSHHLPVLLWEGWITAASLKKKCHHLLNPADVWRGGVSTASTTLHLPPDAADFNRKWDYIVNPYCYSPQINKERSRLPHAHFGTNAHFGDILVKTHSYSIAIWLFMECFKGQGKLRLVIESKERDSVCYNSGFNWGCPSILSRRPSRKVWNISIYSIMLLWGMEFIPAA